MEPKTPQLSAYDLLGYLVPGLSLIALVDLSVAYHFHYVRLDYSDILARYKDVPWKGAVPLVLLAYYLGHLVSFVSAYSVERHARWQYGQPAKILVGEKKPSYFPAKLNCNWFIRLGIITFMLPVAWVEWASRWLNVKGSHFRPFDKLVKDIVNKAYADLLFRASLNIKNYPAKEFTTYDYERLGLHYALESAPSHLYSMRNYIVLYGFLRAMTFILIMITWALLYHCLRSGMDFLQILALFISAGAFTFVSYAAYLKFWFRYHRESMMAVTVIFLKNTQISKSENTKNEPSNAKSE